MNRDAPKGLLLTVIIVGLLLFIIPTSYKSINNNNYRDYIETIATFIQSNEAGKSDNGTKMYRLVYRYNVNENQYYYETDYTTSVIPKLGSEIKIKYNPDIPSQAYSKSFDVFSVFQIVGSVFIFIALITLFSDMKWLRDIIMFLFTIGFILTFIINNFYNGAYIFVIIIFRNNVFCFYNGFYLECKTQWI